MILNKQKTVILKLIIIFLNIFFLLGLTYYNLRHFKISNTVEKIEQKNESSSKSMDIKTVTAFISYMKKQGYNVAIENIENVKGFSIPILSIKINEAPLILADYNSTDEAKKDAKKILGTSDSRLKDNVEQHYYRNSNFIVLYSGADTKLLAILEKVFGPQFAGE